MPDGARTESRTRAIAWALASLNLPLAATATPRRREPRPRLRCRPGDGCARRGKTSLPEPTVQTPVPSRPGRRLLATHASMGLPAGSQRPFEIPCRLRATNAHRRGRRPPTNAADQAGPAVIRRRGSTPSNRVSTAWVCRSITLSASMVLGPTRGLLFTVSSRGDCGCGVPVNSR